MADQTITLTVTLPDDLYQLFQQHAALKQRSVAQDLVALAMDALVQDELPVEVNQEVAALAHLDTPALWQTARRQLTAEQSATLENLLFKQQRAGLTRTEKMRLEQLRYEHDTILVVRASAIGLLHDRGEDVQSLLADANARP